MHKRPKLNKIVYETKGESLKIAREKAHFPPKPSARENMALKRVAGSLECIIDNGFVL